MEWSSVAWEHIFTMNNEILKWILYSQYELVQIVMQLVVVDEQRKRDQLQEYIKMITDDSDDPKIIQWFQTSRMIQMGCIRF